MKVVLLAPTPPPIGGIAMWTMRMLNAKLKNNWQVEIVDEKLIGSREVFGDKTKRKYLSEVKRCFRIWGGLKKALKDDDVKVVHSCIPATIAASLREYICACITKKYKKKFIIHFRCTIPNSIHGRLNRRIVKHLCDKSDCVIALNSQSVDYVKNISKTRVQLIPNFVDITEIENNHIIREEVKYVLYVGGVIKEKGCLDILEIAKVFPNIEFRFIGKSENIIQKEAELLPNVVLLGEKDHSTVHDEMIKADIFVFLSYFNGEGFSNALAEAMACGMPCLVSDWAANKDMIEDQGGEIVPIKSPQIAVEAFRRMFPVDRRKKQSEFNKNKVQLAYVSEIILDQYVDIYESLIKNSSKW